MSDFYFYGGIGLIVVCFLLICILLPIFRAKRRRLIKKIESGEKY